MNSEKIFRIFWIAYIDLFNEYGERESEKYVSYRDKKYEYDCTQIFWRFYWCYKYKI